MAFGYSTDCCPLLEIPDPQIIADLVSIVYEVHQTVEHPRCDSISSVSNRHHRLMSVAERMVQPVKIKSIKRQKYVTNISFKFSTNNVIQNDFAIIAEYIVLSAELKYQITGN